jgi:DNA-binding transcriptional MerR regulator
MNNDLTLEDLASHSGLTLRTLRFYIQEGLLQGPDTHGKYAKYSQQHLERLEMIQRLKNLRLPIKEIRHLLNNMTADEISQIRQYQDDLNPVYSINKLESISDSSTASPGSSALEYLRNLETGQKNINTYSSTPAIKKPARVPRPAPVYKHQVYAKGDQESWKRIVIDDGIEFNVREPIDMDEELKVRKLIEYARALFGSQSK